jgi:hypothetical protein
MNNSTPIIRSSLRNDLLDRIKDRHFVWWNDSLELYRMAGFKPSAFGNDVLTVLTYQVIWMLQHYEVDLDAFIKILRQSFKAYKDLDK